MRLRGAAGGRFAVAVAACALTAVSLSAQTGPKPQSQMFVSLQEIGLDEFEPAVRDQIRQAHEDARKRPEDAASVGKLGMIFQVYGKYELAETCYLRAHGLDPRSLRWVYYLGHVEGWLGRHAEAIGHLRTALKIDEGSPSVKVRLAELLFESGDVAESANLYREALGQDPRLASAHFGLGKILAAQGNLSEAAESYRRACEISESYAAAHYALAMAYRQMGDVAKARAQLERYQNLKQRKQPSFDPLLDEVQALYAGGLTQVAKGSALVGQGKLREAAAEFESALEVNPNLVIAHVNLIAMYGQLGQPEKAEAHFRAAVELDPGWVEIYYNWGMFQLQRGEKARAGQMFRKAVEMNPNYADAHVQLAALLDESGRPEEAASHYQEALRLNPGHRQAHFLLAHSLVRRERLEEAIRHFLRTIEVEDNRTPVGMHALAIAYERTGDRELALYYLQQARRRAVSYGMKSLVQQLDRDKSRLQSEARRP